MSVILSRLSRGLIVVVALSGLAACAGGGRALAPGEGIRLAPARTPAAAAPVVTDPAPIVPGTMRRYQIRGRWYQPEEQPDYDVTGLASWYGAQFDGRPTATGERFDMNALTAAHKTLPLPGLVEVTNLANGRRVVLRVNDRGPFVDDRIIDLSRGAAEALDLLARGVGEVRVRYLGRAPRLGGGTVLQATETSPPPALATAATPGAAYWIQAGEFAAEGQAETAARGLGPTARVQAASDRSMFRVLLGPWPDANAAERARQGAVAQGYGGAVLISSR